MIISYICRLFCVFRSLMSCSIVLYKQPEADVYPYHLIFQMKWLEAERHLEMCLNSLQQLSDRIRTRIQFLFPNIPFLTHYVIHSRNALFLPACYLQDLFSGLPWAKFSTALHLLMYSIELSLNILIPQVVLVNSFAFKRTLENWKELQKSRCTDLIFRADRFPT